MGGTDIDRENDSAENGWDVDVPLSGGGDGGGGCAGGGELRCPPSEHRRKFYHKKAHYGPVSGGVVAPRILGIKYVVGTGGNISRGDKGGGPDGIV